MVPSWLTPKVVIVWLLLLAKFMATPIFGRSQSINDWPWLVHKRKLFRQVPSFQFIWFLISFHLNCQPACLLLLSLYHPLQTPFSAQSSQDIRCPRSKHIPITLPTAKYQLIGIGYATALPLSSKRRPFSGLRPVSTVFTLHCSLAAPDTPSVFSWCSHNITPTITTRHYNNNAINNKFEISHKPEYKLYGCRDVASCRNPRDVSRSQSQSFPFCAGFNAARFRAFDWTVNTSTPRQSSFTNCVSHHGIDSVNIDNYFKTVSTLHLI